VPKTPPKHDLGKREVITVSVYAREHTLIRRAAFRAGMNVAQWCRIQIMKELGVDPIPRKRGRPRKVRDDL